MPAERTTRTGLDETTTRMTPDSEEIDDFLTWAVDSGRISAGAAAIFRRLIAQDPAYIENIRQLPPGVQHRPPGPGSLAADPAAQRERKTDT